MFYIPGTKMRQPLGRVSSFASDYLTHQRLRHAGAASILRPLRLGASAQMRSHPHLNCPHTLLALVDGPLAALTRTRLVHLSRFFGIRFFYVLGFSDIERMKFIIIEIL